jgi:hypothetical protein
MSERDAADGSFIMDRIGAALDRIGRAGYDEIHDAVAQNARHRMSIIKREHYPATKARRLIYLAEQCERLADTLEQGGSR